MLVFIIISLKSCQLCTSLGRWQEVQSVCTVKHTIFTQLTCCHSEESTSPCVLQHWNELWWKLLSASVPTNSTIPAILAISPVGVAGHKLLGRNSCAELQKQTWVWWYPSTSGDWRSLERQTWASHTCTWASVQWAWRMANSTHGLGLDMHHSSVASDTPLNS